MPCSAKNTPRKLCIGLILGLLIQFNLVVELIAGRAVFLVAAAFVLYVVFGYPVLLAWLGRRANRPVSKAPGRWRVSVLLPVRDGAAYLRAKLQSILTLEYPRELTQVVVVSDGSTDGSDEIVREFGRFGVELVRIPAGGKAAAINAGLERCRGDIVFFTDVRQELAPDSLKQLAACFADPQVGAVSGELIIRDGQSREEADIGLYWRYEKWIRAQLSRIDSMLGATGCIYAIRRDLAAPLPPDTLLDDVWLPLAAFFRGYRVVLTGARAYDEPMALKTEFRRKVRTLAGMYQVIVRQPALLTPSNRMWIHFVSHKLGRLLLPWACLAVFAASFSLPPVWVQTALAIQGGFYGLAALDVLFAESHPLKRLSSPARTFVVLMGASLCAVSIFFVDSRKLWSRPTEQARSRAAGA